MYGQTEENFTSPNIVPFLYAFCVRTHKIRPFIILEINLFELSDRQ